MSPWDQYTLFPPRLLGHYRVILHFIRRFRVTNRIHCRFFLVEFRFRATGAPCDLLVSLNVFLGMAPVFTDLSSLVRRQST